MNNRMGIALALTFLNYFFHLSRVICVSKHIVRPGGLISPIIFAVQKLSECTVKGVLLEWRGLGFVLTLPFGVALM